MRLAVISDIHGNLTALEHGARKSRSVDCRTAAATFYDDRLRSRRALRLAACRARNVAGVAHAGVRCSRRARTAGERLTGRSVQVRSGRLEVAFADEVELAELVEALESAVEG